MTGGRAAERWRIGRRRGALLLRNHVQASPRALSGSWPASACSRLHCSRPPISKTVSWVSRKELHEKMGLPQAVRDRKSALRVFSYYAITDWDKYFRKLVSPRTARTCTHSSRMASTSAIPSVMRWTPMRIAKTGRYMFAWLTSNFRQPYPSARFRLLFLNSGLPLIRHRLHFDRISGSFFKGPASPQARFIVKEAGKDSPTGHSPISCFRCKVFPTL